MTAVFPVWEKSTPTRQGSLVDLERTEFYLVFLLFLFGKHLIEFHNG